MMTAHLTEQQHDLVAMAATAKEDNGRYRYTLADTLNALINVGAMHGYPITRNVITSVVMEFSKLRLEDMGTGENVGTGHISPQAMVYLGDSPPMIDRDKCPVCKCRPIEPDQGICRQCTLDNDDQAWVDRG